MRLASWNVNSIKVRLPRLLDWLERLAPDVVCLQETKSEPGAFPADALRQAGYTCAHASGGRWNGVAILSTSGLSDVLTDWPAGATPDWPAGVAPDAGRLLLASTAGLRVASVYVPNGRTLDSWHYSYKLAWMERLRGLAAAELAAAAPLVLAGDFNIAPADHDVWDPAAFEGATHVSAAERAALTALEALGLEDVTRRRWPSEQVFTFWDYRMGMFHKNQGMRIDLLLAAHCVADRVAGVWVDRLARRGSAPSDHAPLVVELDTARADLASPMIPMPSRPLPPAPTR